MGEYKYFECEMRKRLGISDGLIKKTRREVLDKADFALVDRRIAYSKDGAEKVLESLLGHPSVKDQAEFAKLIAECVKQAVPAEKQAVTAVRLLSAPWEVPNAVLVVVRLTKNHRIMMCRLHEDWVREHGYNYFHQVLSPILSKDERRNPDLFKTKLFRVRVNTNVNFIQGMEVECRHLGQDFWDCTQRLPRWRGKY